MFDAFRALYASRARVLLFPVFLCLAVTLLFATQSLTGLACGVRPRQMSGLWCLPFSPFFHVGWLHLLSNLPPLLFLSLLFAVRAGTFAMACALTLALSVAGGAVIWVMGSSGVHMGASLLVFSYLGFLAGGVAAASGGGILKSLLNASLGLIALGMYWWLLPSLLAVAPGVSWSAHAGGLVTGFVAGRISR